MNTSVKQEMEALENHLIDGLQRPKQPYLRKLLRIVDQFLLMESRRFGSSRKLGHPDDGHGLLKLVADVKHCWSHLSNGLNPTEEALVMGLLRLRDAIPHEGWLMTAKGQFPLE